MERRLLAATHWTNEKSHLMINKTLGKASSTLTELQMLTPEVEAVLNDRPITYVSSDCVEEEPLI